MNMQLVTKHINMYIYMYIYVCVIYLYTQTFKNRKIQTLKCSDKNILKY